MYCVQIVQLQRLEGDADRSILRTKALDFAENLDDLLVSTKKKLYGFISWVFKVFETITFDRSYIRYSNFSLTTCKIFSFTIFMNIRK